MTLFQRAAKDPVTGASLIEVLKLNATRIQWDDAARITMVSGIQSPIEATCGPRKLQLESEKWRVHEPEKKLEKEPDIKKQETRVLALTLKEAGEICVRVKWGAIGTNLVEGEMVAGDLKRLLAAFAEEPRR